MAKMSPVSMTPAELVAVRRTRCLRAAEKNVLVGHVLDSLNESARLRLPWEEAWARATADDVEPLVRYLTQKAKRLYDLRVSVLK